MRRAATLNASLMAFTVVCVRVRRMVRRDRTIRRPEWRGDPAVRRHPVTLQQGVDMADTLMLHFPRVERTAQDAAHLLDKLMSSSLADWVSAATAQSPDGERTPDEEVLAMALESPELSYRAWLIRDQVETACCRFDSVDGRRACSRARLRDVRRATERAALALLARPSLSPDVFRALYGHFERVLPIADLRSHS